MKNYKFLVPVGIVLIYAASVYFMYSSRAAESNQYNQYIAIARDFRRQDIQVDAEKNYEKAISLNPSLELYLEIGEFYHETNQVKKAINWGNQILTTFPKQKEGYEFLIGIYAERGDYVACYKLADTLQKRDVISERVSEVIDSIKYEFYFNEEFADVGIFSAGLCPVKTEGKWGYVDNTGHKVIANKFLEVGYHSGNLAPVIDSEGEIYYIDETGNKKKVILNIEGIQQLGLIENGVFSLYDGKTWGFYDEGEQLLFGGYDEVSSMGNGVAAVMQDGKWTLVDRGGNPLTEQHYDGVVMDEKRVVYRNERIFVFEGYDCYMIDLEGNNIGSAYQDAKVFNDGSYAAVELNNRWGFVDKEGEIKIEPCYEDARSFSNGLAAVKYAGKWGFIDIDGNMVIDSQFDDAKDFTGAGSVFVKKGDAWNLLRLYKDNH